MSKLSESEQALIDRDVEEMVSRATNPEIKTVNTVNIKSPITDEEMKKIDIELSKYKFNEDKNLQELFAYVAETYSQHYSGKFQTVDVIIDSGHGTGFCVGSIMKYAKRYGKKEGYNRNDILKMLHYGLILLYIHDMENK